MGISVVSYTLKDVHDDQVLLSCQLKNSLSVFFTETHDGFTTMNLSSQDYLHSLGKARTAQVQKDARIGEAQNKRDAVIRVR